MLFFPSLKNYIINIFPISRETQEKSLVFHIWLYTTTKIFDFFDRKNNSTSNTQERNKIRNKRAENCSQSNINIKSPTFNGLL